MERAKVCKHDGLSSDLYSVAEMIILYMPDLPYWVAKWLGERAVGFQYLAVGTTTHVIEQPYQIDNIGGRRISTKVEGGEIARRIVERSRNCPLC